MTEKGSATLAGLASHDDVAGFFQRFATVVLVANSDAVDLPRLRTHYGPDALFVFFNKVYKVLDEPFNGRCILVARSSPAGANIVYRREVPEVLALVDGPGFGGVLNLRCGADEVFSDTNAFGRPDVGHLDLVARNADFYPASHVPTSGFGLALFLSEHCPGMRVALAGFTAKRSLKWKLFADHDWTFEQIVLRLLFRKGRLEVAPGSPGAGAGAFSAIAERFPDLQPAEISLVANEVLADRLAVANSAIERLFRLTRMQERIDGWVRSLKPRTRKARLAADRTTQNGSV